MNTKTLSTPAQRLPITIKVEYRRTYARSYSSGRLRNISLTGVFLETDESSLLVNDKLVLTFKVSGRKRDIPAKVIWSTQSGYGIQLLPCSNRDIQIIDDLIYFTQLNRETQKNLLQEIFHQVNHPSLSKDSLN